MREKGIKGGEEEEGKKRGRKGGKWRQSGKKGITRGKWGKGNDVAWAGKGRGTFDLLMGLEPEEHKRKPKCP